MRILPLIAVAAMLSATPALAAKAVKAPAKPAATAAAAPAGEQAPAQVQDAMLYLKVLISALQSDKIEQPAKGALVGCLYNNSLGKITESMDKLIAANPGKVSRDNPNQLLGALAAVCGYEPTAAAAAQPGATPKPTSTPTGR